MCPDKKLGTRDQGLGISDWGFGKNLRNLRRKKRRKIPAGLCRGQPYHKLKGVNLKTFFLYFAKFEFLMVWMDVSKL